MAFDIDANGIAHVSAKDLGTGQEQKIRIESSSGLSDAEIQQMVQDAEQHSEEDKQKKEEIELRNHADSLIYSTEQSIKEYEDKISAEDRNAAEDAMQKLRETLKGDNIDQIRGDMEALTQASHKLAEVMYAQATDEEVPASATEGNTTSEGDTDETVIDVEGEVVEEDSDDNSNGK